MAPPRRYELPNEQLSRLLAEARADGLGFADAWDQIVRPGKPIVMTTTKNPPARALRWPTDRTDRETWRAAIQGAVEGWRRCYYREPMTAPERALSFLLGEFKSLDIGALVAAAGDGIRDAGAVRSAA